MAKLLIALFLMFLSFFNMAAHGAQVPESGRWRPQDMDPRIAPGSGFRLLPLSDEMTKAKLIPDGVTGAGDPPCDDTSACTFDLFSFKGEAFDLNQRERKNILFIAGGPGQFVEENESFNAALNALAAGVDVNGRHNILYFHVRGAGRSPIDPNNQKDRFLRARFVVEDIELLRKRILVDKPWDAIYAHSWGTVVAQLYAAKYGTKKNPSGEFPMVKSLILSGPVVRNRPETLNARIDMTISNLGKIYNYYRPNGDCTFPVGALYLKDRIADFATNPQGFGREDLDETDNLCFVGKERIPEITKTVKNILTDLEKDYGSLDFVIENFEALEKDRVFTAQFKSPLEFFVALRGLQLSGAPAQNGLVFTEDTKNMINNALVVAYYLSPALPQNLERRQCESNEQFMPGVRAGMRKKYCDRLMVVKKKFLGAESPLSGKLESRRDKYVFGVYDGVARWVFNMLDVEQGCFTGLDLKNFANARSSSTDKKKHVREIAKKIGIVPKERVCGWSPGGKNAHSVPTLILKGTADAIVAGCQAEDWYNDGLKGERVLLEFPGVGHDMSIGNQRIGSAPLDQTQSFADVIEQFIVMAQTQQQSQFVSKVKPKLEFLKAEEKKPGPSCNPLQPID